MQKRFIEVPKTARYYLLGNRVNPENIWLCTHGYGQQAKFFAAKTKALDNGKNLILVVEALNRFYLSGFSGRVGATWMTSDDREKDIEDNQKYLDLLVKSVVDEFSIQKCPISVLAFSQGIATMCRWMAKTEFEFTQAILWAGSIPPEMIWKESAAKFNRINIKYVVGDKDEFLTKENVQENLQLWQNASINYQLVTFEGKHEMNEPVLISLIE